MVKKSKWENLEIFDKTIILTAALMETMFMGLIILNGKNCFRDFQLSSKISDPLNKGGLNGDVSNIIKPQGYFALFLFFVGTILIYYVKKRLKNLTKMNENKTDIIVSKNRE